MNKRMREFWRKIAHVLIGSGCVFGAYLVLQRWGAQTLDCVLAGVLGVLVLADVLIADYGWKLPLYHHLQRAHEERGLHTATLGFLGSVLAYKLFALPVAIAAIGMLIFGDAAAAIAGMLANAKKKRALPRTAAMLVVSVVLGWFVFGWIGAAMGVVAALAEAFVAKIDDAITIPVFAGLAGHLLMQYFL